MSSILQDHCGYAHSSWEDWGYIHILVCVGLCIVTTTTSIWLFLYVQCLYLNGIKFMLIFFCRVPMYGELKLALFIYLWYPKTKVKKNIKAIVEIITSHITMFVSELWNIFCASCREAAMSITQCCGLMCISTKEALRRCCRIGGYGPGIWPFSIIKTAPN